MPTRERLLSDLSQSVNYFHVAQSLARAGAFVCGGGVRDLFLGRKPNDLDIFVTQEQTNAWFRVLRESGFHQIRRKFFRNGIELDIVSTAHMSAIDVIMAFDCDVCKWYMVDKPVPLNAEVQIATNKLTATFDSKMDLFGTSPRRADKLRATGWKVNIL